MFEDARQDETHERSFEAAAEGSYDVWIGSYESAGCNATVTLETF